VRQFIRECEARAFFGGKRPISRSQWWRLRKAGIVPEPVRLGAGSIFYDLQELETAAERLRQARDSKVA
jgi:predicted DNA-binding transcriptional regulator AlpA